MPGVSAPCQVPCRIPCGYPIGRLVAPDMSSSPRGSKAVDAEQPGSVGARRLAIHYAVLALVTAGVAVFVFPPGATKRAQPQIAGGYDVSAAAACLGPKIEL